MAGPSVRLHPDAIIEAKAAYEWYAERNPSAANAVIAELDHAIGKSDSPERWTCLARRGNSPPTFSGMISLRITESAIQVISVSHGRRRPGYWSRGVSNRYVHTKVRTVELALLKSNIHLSLLPTLTPKITLSARANTFGGIVRPSLRRLEIDTNSTWVGKLDGKSRAWGLESCPVSGRACPIASSCRALSLGRSLFQWSKSPGPAFCRDVRNDRCGGGPFRTSAASDVPCSRLETPVSISFELYV